jgi:hypothetical protein
VNRPRRFATTAFRSRLALRVAVTVTRSPALNPRPATPSGDPGATERAGFAVDPLEPVDSLERMVAAIAAELTTAAPSAAAKTQRNLTVRMWFAKDTAPANK